MPRTLLRLCLITWLLTTLWVILLIVENATAGPLETLAQVLAHVSRLRPITYANYANAALLTVAATALFAALSVERLPCAPVWAPIALAFVPIYGALNLVSYLAQITVVPMLVRLQTDGELGAMAVWGLRLLVHTAPGSFIAFTNALAYAVLGIPSAIVGALRWRRSAPWRWAAALLIASAVADVMALVGMVAASETLQALLLVGGVLFWAALLAMTLALRREARAGA